MKRIAGRGFLFNQLWGGYLMMMDWVELTAFNHVRYIAGEGERIFVCLAGGRGGRGEGEWLWANRLDTY